MEISELEKAVRALAIGNTGRQTLKLLADGGGVGMELSTEFVVAAKTLTERLESSPRNQVEQDQQANPWI